MLKKFIADLKKEFEGYNGQGLSKDIMAGITVAAVALPLALAFGVSSGADAAAGLVTAIIAGIVIGGLSGASYQISGPTGAMAAILMGLSATHGISGVLTAGLLSGVILLIVALLRADKLVSYIPSPVITGFTSGIAIIIALGQIDNFFGTTSEGTSALLKLASYARLGFSPELMSVIFGGAVVLIMLIYPKKWQKYFPSSLFSLIVVLVANLIMFPEKGVVAEVGAIPKSLMTPEALLIKGIDFKNIASYIAPAISVAALGMVESLLCGTSASKMKNEKFDSRRELVAQGVGNVIIPLLGGVPATAAIARTSVAIKSGGKTRLVSVFHSVTLILSMFLLSGVMSRIPLCALAGVLMVTAWRMNEWDEIKKIFKNRYKTEISQFLITMVATVIFDLTVAIVIGVAFSMFMFVVKSCDLTVNISKINLDVTKEKGIVGSYKYTKIVYLAGPMFFGTQDKLTKALEQIEDDTCDIIFSMRGVPSIDSSALEELSEICEEFRKKDVRVLFCGVNDKVMKTLDLKGFKAEIGEENFLWDAVSAIKKIEKEVFITE